LIEIVAQRLNSLLNVELKRESGKKETAQPGDGSLHPEFTDDVLQTAKDRAHMLFKVRELPIFFLTCMHLSLISCIADAEVAFNDPNTLQNILATLQRLEASQARLEARLDNVWITLGSSRGMDCSVHL
jgi:hypothetical protein